MRFLKSKGFTLIELLIVVAIIAILAAIAVPNFLEAQVRSKVSRQKSNMRTMATALESYAIDNNKYPPCTDSPAMFGGPYPAEEMWKIMPGKVTTPIAYISSDAAMVDIFRKSHNFPTNLANQVMYLPTHYYQPPHTGNEGSYPGQMNFYGYWVLRSAGPDTYYQNRDGIEGDYGAGNWGGATYDPTNGSVSNGDIPRSQKDPDYKYHGSRQ